MYLPAFLFDIFCSRVAREFITGSLSSPDSYAKKYSQEAGEEYAEVSEALYIGAATEIVQFLSEIDLEKMQSTISIASHIIVYILVI